MSAELKIELIHAIFWMGHVGVIARRDCSGLEPASETGTYAPDLEIRDEVSFGTNASSEDPEPEETLLRRLHNAGLCDVSEEDYGHMCAVRVSPAPYDTLRAKLGAADLSTLPEGLAIDAFLSNAANFTGAQYIGARPALEALPTTTEWFRPPRHFKAAVAALAEAGFADKRADTARWTAKIAPHMEATWCWIDGRPTVEIRRDRTLHIWTSAPDDIRAAFLAEPAGFNVLAFSKVMEAGWDPGRDRWLHPGETRKRFNTWGECANAAGALRLIDEDEGLPGRGGPFVPVDRRAGKGT